MRAQLARVAQPGGREVVGVTEQTQGSGRGQDPYWIFGRARPRWLSYTTWGLCPKRPPRCLGGHTLGRGLKGEKLGFARAVRSAMG